MQRAQVRIAYSQKCYWDDAISMPKAIDIEYLMLLASFGSSIIKMDFSTIDYLITSTSEFDLNWES